jgi:hypothetical protein
MSNIDMSAVVRGRERGMKFEKESLYKSFTHTHTHTQLQHPLTDDVILYEQNDQKKESKTNQSPKLRSFAKVHVSIATYPEYIGRM